jgi:uncharacterized protein
LNSILYKKYAKIAILSVFILTLFFIWHTKNLKFDYNFENFFPTGDPELEYFLNYREKFENDNDYLLIGLENQDGIFRADFLKKLEGFTSDLKKSPHVDALIDPINLKNLLITPGGLIDLPVLNWKDSTKLISDSIAIFKNPSLVKSFFSEDGKSVNILIKHTQKIKKAQADSLYQYTLSLLDSYSFDKVHIAGKAQAQGVYISKMQQELIIFFSISIILVILFLTVAYRSLIGVIVPLVVVLLSTIWVIGFMGAVDKPLDIMMVLLPTIMFVVGMSDVVHIQTKYIEELRNGSKKLKALVTTFKEVGLATFLTSLTTAVGFLTLYTSSIKPIREFGLFTAIGVFIAFILAFTVFPSILIFTKKPPVTVIKHNKTRWTKALRKIILFNFKHPVKVILASLAITIISILGIYQIKINTFILEDLPDNDPLKEDFRFFDRNFGGARPFEMAIWVNDTSKNIYDLQVLREIEKIENYLIGNYGLTNVISPVVAVKSIQKAMNSGIQNYFILPDSDQAFSRIRRFISILQKRNKELKITSDENKTARISGKMADIGSAVAISKNDELHTFISENVDISLISYRLTGTSHLLDKNNEYLALNMMQGLAIAFGIIAIIVGIMFRSLRMVLIALIPNVIPLIIVAGIMGFAGITLKLSTSIIFTIAFGIAVDDTIHFISKLKIELNKGRTMLYALKRTFFSTGKAIIVTTLILSGGFLTLILSSFGGTFYTGLLVSLTLLLAVVVDLTLLPVLLVLFYKRKEKLKRNFSFGRKNAKLEKVTVNT